MSEEIRAARQARRDADRLKMDADAAESRRVDDRISAATSAAVETLPAGVGAAVAALLTATKPWLAPDGHLSVSAIGRSSPEVLALAEALLAPQPPPVASDCERVLAGLRESLVTEHRKYDHPDRYAVSDWYTAFGLETAIALVEAAQQRLTERDRGRERG